MTCCVSSWRSISWSDLFNEIMKRPFPHLWWKRSCYDSISQHNSVSFVRFETSWFLPIPFNTCRNSCYLNIEFYFTCSFHWLSIGQVLRWAPQGGSWDITQSKQEQYERSLDTRWCGIEPTRWIICSLYLRGFIHRAIVLSYVSLQHANMHASFRDPVENFQWFGLCNDIDQEMPI